MYKCNIMSEAIFSFHFEFIYQHLVEQSKIERVDLRTDRILLPR